MIIDTWAAVASCIWLMLLCCLQQVASRSLAPPGHIFYYDGEDSVKKRSVSESETLLSRHKRFLILYPNNALANPQIKPTPGVNAWNIAKDGPVKVGWSSLLPATDVLTRASQEEVIVSCLRKWAEPSGLVFTYLGGPVTEQDVNILISFTPLNLPGETKAVAQSPNPSQNPPVSTVKFDSTKGPYKPFGDLVAPAGMFFLSLEMLMCHEIGHTLNLAHPSRIPKDLSVMNSPVPNLDTRVVLSPDDIAGIQFIYGTANGMTLTGGVSISPTPQPTITTTPRPTTTTTPRPTTITTPRPTTTTTPRPTTTTSRPITTTTPRPTTTTTPRPITTTTPRPTTTTPRPTTTTTPRPTTTTPRPTTTTTPRPTTTTPNYPWRGLAQRLTGPVAARTPRPPSTTQRVTVATTRMTASPSTRGLVTAPPAPTNPPTAPTSRPATSRPTTRRPATRRPTNRRPANRRPRNGRNRNRRPVNRGRNRGGGRNQNCRRPNRSIKARCLRRG